MDAIQQSTHGNRSAMKAVPEPTLQDTIRETCGVARRLWRFALHVDGYFMTICHTPSNGRPSPCSSDF